jgi:ribosomal protein L37AE/L43A
MGVADPSRMRYGLVYQCQTCGASLEISPDAVVYICPYCGSASSLEGGGVELTGLMPTSADDVSRAVAGFLRSKAGREARIRDVKVLMLPFWAVHQRVKTRYNGYRREYRSTGKGQYPVYVPVKGELDEEMTTIVYARAFEAVFGLEDLKERVLLRLREAGKFDPVKAAKHAKLIAPEVSEQEAIERAKTIASETHRRKVQRMTTKLFDCYTESEPLSTKLIMYPVAVIDYEWEGRKYRASADASVNAPDRVLKAELPMGGRYRLLVAMATAGLVLLISLAAVLSQAALNAGFVEGEGALLAVVLPPAAAAAVGFFGSRRATAEHRVYRRGKRFQLPEIPVEAEDIIAKLRGGLP